MLGIKILISVVLFLTVRCELTVDEYNDLINNFLKSTETYQYPTDAKSFVEGEFDTKGCYDGGEYDFIIVGAGSSGTVLASRLSEIQHWNVLLLEAGGEENEISDIPAFMDYLRLSDFNWGYKTVPQKNSLFGFINNTQIIPRGKVLGGSSTINALMYVRGNRLDYDKWGRRNPGWAYNEVLPYFKKSENASIWPEDENYHGHDGPLHVENVNVLTPLTDAFISAIEEVGHKVLDYNGKNQFGFSQVQLTAKGGKRLSGNKAFLEPNKYRNNLKIRTKALVLQLLMEKKTVYGVKYMQGGNTYCAYKKKEVILSAGTINSAQLLMLAGIGPKDHLEELGINVIKDLPVGKNVWDHINFPSFTLTTNLTLPYYSQKELIEQYLNGKGSLTSAFSLQVLGFPEGIWTNGSIPDIEYIMTASRSTKTRYEYFQKITNYKKEIYDSVNKPVEDKVVLKIASILLHPLSRGTIRLKSNNPFDFPLIDTNYFSDPQNVDINTMISSQKELLKLVNTKALQRFNSTLVKIELPACKKYEFGTNDYFACLIKYMASTLFHLSGSCKMGPRFDKSSVVDRNLKVHGINGIRVADCSVIPVTTSGHTNAPAYVVGEKAGDIIKNYWLPCP